MPLRWPTELPRVLGLGMDLRKRKNNTDALQEMPLKRLENALCASMKHVAYFADVAMEDPPASSSTNGADAPNVDAMEDAPTEGGSSSVPAGSGSSGFGAKLLCSEAHNCTACAVKRMCHCQLLSSNT